MTQLVCRYFPCHQGYMDNLCQSGPGANIGLSHHDPASRTPALFCVVACRGCGAFARANASRCCFIDSQWWHPPCGWAWCRAWLHLRRATSTPGSKGQSHGPECRKLQSKVRVNDEQSVLPVLRCQCFTLSNVSAAVAASACTFQVRVAL